MVKNGQNAWNRDSLQLPALLTYPTKKKCISKIFPLSSPFNAKMLIVIKYLFLIKILIILEGSVDEYLCLSREEKSHQGEW